MKQDSSEKKGTHSTKHGVMYAFSILALIYAPADATTGTYTDLAHWWVNVLTVVLGLYAAILLVMTATYAYALYRLRGADRRVETLLSPDPVDWEKVFDTSLLGILMILIGAHQGHYAYCGSWAGALLLLWAGAYTQNRLRDAIRLLRPRGAGKLHSFD